MSERLMIHNFAGIQEIDISLSDINILIGPQATGKSICAKVLYYFKSFVTNLFTAIETEQTKRQFDQAVIQKFETYFPSQSLGNGDFSLRYEVDDTFIEITRQNGKVRLTYSDYYKQELKTWRSILRTALEKVDNENQTLRRFDALRVIRRQFLNAQEQKLGAMTTYSQVFIPAGRSFFAILQSSIFSFLSSNKAIDPFLAEFGSFYEDIKTPRWLNIPRDESDKKLKARIDDLTESILQGKHVIEKGGDFLRLADGRKISLVNSSSGQQEMLPLALILESIPFLRLAGGAGNVVYIEEPEAHLFPTAQQKIVQLIATIFNQSRIPVQFIITTHSPYILAAFNNLMYAGNISSRLPSDQMSRLGRVVPEEQFVNLNNMQAYSLHDGTCTSIISQETGLISTTMLDDVSDELALQFDRILDFEE